MQGGKVRGFVVSSGCANAVTGQRGLEDAWKMSKTVDNHAPRGPTTAAEVGGTLVMSTGVIGQHLPIEKITTSIPPLLSSLSSTPEAWLGLAKAFMTTDTFPKLRTREFKINDQLIKLVGIDKGAGMIHPNMGPPHGTLLGVIATDAKVHPEALQKALGWAVDRSFNSITVDGDMSTNDTVLCLANGAAGTSEGGSSGGMKEISEKGTPEEYEVFKNELTGFAEELAQLVVRDGEGATKFVTVRVEVSFDVPGGLWSGRKTELMSECVFPTWIRTHRRMRWPERWLPLSRRLLWSRRPCTVKVSHGGVGDGKCLLSPRMLTLGSNEQTPTGGESCVPCESTAVYLPVPVFHSHDHD